MPIDANIALQSQAPSIPPFVQQLQAMKTAGLNNQIQQGTINAQGQEATGRDIQKQSDQIKLNQAGQGQQDNSDYRAAMAAAVDPNTGQVDKGVLLSTLGKLNPAAAAQTAQSLTAQQTAAQEAQQKLQQAQLATADAHVKFKDQILQNVTDPISYANARNLALQAGISPNEMPAQYDPAFVAQAHAQTLTQQDQITNALNAQKEKDAAAKNMADMPPQTKAVNIMAIPADQRTPEQVNYLAAYKQNNDMTKIQPAQVRANVMLQMPQAIEDPNNPGHTIYVTRQNAIGQTTVQDSSVTNPKNTLKDFTSGTDSHTLTAINTAQGHIQQLFGAADALQNGNIKVLNQIGNEYGVQTGQSAPATFQAIKTALTGELGKAFSGAGATVSEQAELSKTMDAANSPTQLKDVATTYNHLMDTKRAALQQQFQNGMQGKPNFGSSSTTSTPTQVTPQTHQFSLSAWQQANPKGDPMLAKRAAAAQGYTVVP